MVGRLLAIHSCIAGYKDASILRCVLGGVFTHHPEQCQVTVEAKGEHIIEQDIFIDEDHLVLRDYTLKEWCW